MKSMLIRCCLSLVAIALVSALASPFICNAQYVKQFRDVYFFSGVPLDSKTTWDNVDIKFQVSVRSSDLLGGKHDNTELFFGYTQTSVWNIFAESCPFKDNTYNPGIYWSKAKKNGTLTIGIEHMSNGRPYFGNPVAREGYDDMSRALNYFVMERVWPISSGQWTFRVKAGVTCGIGDYQRSLNFLTQDMFLYYLGYATILYDKRWGDWSLHMEATPIVNKAIANADARVSYRFSPSWPSLSFSIYHGYECLCDCRPGNSASNSARLGLTFEIFR